MSLSKRISLAVLAALLPAAGAAQPPQSKSVFVITDAEGVGGVCRQDQTDPKDTEMQALLTGEIRVTPGPMIP